MAALDYITLADLKTYGLLTGSNRDAVLAQFVTVASRQLDNLLGRRLVYRAPPETANADNIVVSRALANETVPGVSITQPAAGRTLIINFSGSPSAALVVVTGTVAGVAGTTETFDFANGARQHGLKFFTAISSIVVTATGAGTLTIGASVGYIEYHTPDGTSESWPMEWPVAQLLEVNEDVSRTYAASSQLVANTDYILTRSRRGDKLVRLWGTQPGRWLLGFRAIRKTYSGGYTAATVPGDLKDACRKLTKLLYDEVDKNRLGLSGMSDATGNWSRFAAASITPETSAALEQFKRNRFGADTAQVDFDLEAA